MELKLRLDGKEIQVTGQVLGSKIWIHYQGKTFIIDKIEKKAKRTGQGTKVESGIIVAPMPGKITKILAEVGHNMTKGQALIIMEAMKMEYTLKTDKEGLVDSIKVKVGDQVTLGQLLAKVK